MKHWLTRALILTLMPLLLVGSLAVLWQLKPIAIKSDMLALLTPIADAQSGDKDALDKAQNFYLAQQHCSVSSKSAWCFRCKAPTVSRPIGTWLKVWRRQALRYKGNSRS
ncbi:hypothetical protein [Pseudoalteromonas sp. T1lg75]|uniref:hypothetical protein n=1 Tax=Pseudoalteromonas sp. T1lg75 TaxID=2077102 RepID=UPI001319BF6D|nr:hypothetical protein [Pseudoalteromonas sp. T1lg75]